jgi:hypothetical protein
MLKLKKKIIRPVYKLTEKNKKQLWSTIIEKSW